MAMSLFDSTAANRLRLESAIRASQKAAALSDTDAELVLNYCRWKRQQEFTRSMNRVRQDCGLPRDSGAVFLSERQASPIYDGILSEISRELGFTLLGESEIRAVMEAIRSRKALSPARQLKRAEVRFSAVQKFMSNGKRMVRGLASSARPDRVGDVVEPAGGTWNLPVPLLHQHRHDDVIGWVREAQASRDGVGIVAEFAEGIGKADEVWAMVEAGLLDSFSIGFRGLATEPLAGGGLRFTKWELLEVSVVAVPANPDAKIRRAAPAGTIKLTGASGSGDIPGHPGSIRLSR